MGEEKPKRFGFSSALRPVVVCARLRGGFCGLLSHEWFPQRESRATFCCQKVAPKPAASCFSRGRSLAVRKRAPDAGLQANRPRFLSPRLPCVLCPRKAKCGGHQTTRVKASETPIRFRSPQNRSLRPVISALSGNPASRKNWIPRQAGNDGSLRAAVVCG